MKLSAEELAQALEIADMWIKNDAPHSAVPLSKAFRRLEAEYREARQEAARYREALNGLKSLGCWCSAEHNNDPTMMVGQHTGPCSRVRAALEGE